VNISATRVPSQAIGNETGSYCQRMR